MPYDTVREFENRVAEYAGASYAVAVESCSAALFLCCVLRDVKTVTIPKYTYPSVPCSILHAGGRVLFSEEPWEGIYELKPYKIWDSALRFRRGMYGGGLHCLSFHARKRVPIGRGGMVLLENKEERDWLKRARFDGRGEMPLAEDNFFLLGWNMYMTAEQAARGLELFESIKDHITEDLPVEAQGYPDLSRFPIYTRNPAE